MLLTPKDLEIVQARCPDYRLELVNGEIVIMSPSGYESDKVAMRMSAKLFNWVDERRLGRITGSSAGFTLPNSNTRVPDVAFVEAKRLRRSPRSFAELAPDLMVEVNSPTDNLTKLREKIDQFLALGIRVGILINPEQRWVEVRRSQQEPTLLKDGEVLTIPELLPGWEVKIEELWSPEFDEE